MAIRLGDEAPNFTAETTDGTINFHDWLGDGWGVLFSHPKDYTPVCTTELGMAARLKPEFDKRGCKIIGLSVDPLDSHEGWAKDIEETQGIALNFPVIADGDKKVSDLYDMIHPNASDTFTVRSVYVIGPDKKVKLMIVYPMSTGRNFDEVLRVIDSLQLTANYSVATPVNWKDGEDCIIVPSLSDEDAKEKFPAGWKTLKPYLRVTPQPNKIGIGESKAAQVRTACVSGRSVSEPTNWPAANAAGSDSMRLLAESGDENHQIEMKRDGEKVVASIDGRVYDLEVSEPEPNLFLIKNQGKIFEVYVPPGVGENGTKQISVGGKDFDIRLIDPKRLRSSGGGDAHSGGLAEIKTAMPGKVVRILLESGAVVAKGDAVLVVEAMKMQNELKSPKDGILKEIRVEEGATVSAGDILATVE